MTFEDKASYGSYVKTSRQLIGWSQKDLAHWTGININTIASIECGRIKDPRISTVLKLSEVFDEPYWEVQI